MQGQENPCNQRLCVIHYTSVSSRLWDARKIYHTHCSFREAGALTVVIKQTVALGVQEVAFRRAAVEGKNREEKRKCQ